MLTADVARRQARVLARMPAHSFAVVFPWPVLPSQHDVALPFKQSPHFEYVTGVGAATSSVALLLKTPGTNGIVELVADGIADALEDWFRRASTSSTFATAFVSVPPVLVRVPFDTVASQLAHSENTLQRWLRSRGYRVTPWPPARSVVAFEEMSQNFSTRPVKAGGPLTFTERRVDSLVNRYIRKENCVPVPPDDDARRLRSVDALLAPLRRVKSEYELDCLQRSADATAVAFGAAFAASAKLPTTERSVEAQMCVAVHGRGFGYPPVVAAGEAHIRALHHRATHDVVAAPTRWIVDAGCSVDGYACDCTRAWCTDPLLARRDRDAVAALHRVFDEMLRLCRVGRRLREVELEARQLAADALARFGATPRHGIFHHVGLNVHDDETTTSTSSHDATGETKDDSESSNGSELQVGNVLAIEPGVYVDSTDGGIQCGGGVWYRREDTFHLTSSGPRLLTSCVPFYRGMLPR